MSYYMTTLFTLSAAIDRDWVQEWRGHKAAQRGPQRSRPQRRRRGLEVSNERSEYEKANTNHSGGTGSGSAIGVGPPHRLGDRPGYHPGPIPSSHATATQRDPRPG